MADGKQPQDVWVRN